MSEVVVVKKEKTFKHYLELPAEVRMPIIDEMEVMDRCRFTRCSKTCYKEAKASKNYIYRLTLDTYVDKLIIHVMHSPMIESKGFNIEFRTLSNGTKSVVLNSCGEFHTTNYDKSLDLLEYACEHFKNLLKLYQKSIKQLHIHEELFSRNLGNFGVGIDNFKRLEVLSIDIVYMEHLLPKIRHPLKKLIVREVASDTNLMNFEQVHQVQEYLKFLNTRFNYEQLIRLSVARASLHIGELTVENLYNFIRAWQNGNACQNAENYEWRRLKDSKISCDELFRLLRVGDGNPTKLKNYANNKKTARLVYDDGGSLYFIVRTENILL